MSNKLKIRMKTIKSQGSFLCFLYVSIHHLIKYFVANPPPIKNDKKSRIFDIEPSFSVNKLYPEKIVRNIDKTKNT